MKPMNLDCILFARSGMVGKQMSRLAVIGVIRDYTHNPLEALTLDYDNLGLGIKLEPSPPSESSMPTGGEVGSS